MDDSSIPMEFNYPLSDYYKGHVIAGDTLINTGAWWSAVLLIREPKTQKPFIGFYRWQKTKNGWKTRKRFTFKKQDEAKRVIEMIQRFSPKLES